MFVRPSYDIIESKIVTRPNLGYKGGARAPWAQSLHLVCVSKVSTYVHVHTVCKQKPYACMTLRQNVWYTDSAWYCCKSTEIEYITYIGTNHCPSENGGGDLLWPHVGWANAWFSSLSSNMSLLCWNIPQDGTLCTIWLAVQYPFTKFDNVQVDLSLISQIMPIDSPRQNDSRGQSKSGKNSSFSMFKISRLKLIAAGDGMVLFTAFSGSKLKAIPPYNEGCQGYVMTYKIQ